MGSFWKEGLGYLERLLWFALWKLGLACWLVEIYSLACHSELLERLAKFHG